MAWIFCDVDSIKDIDPNKDECKFWEIEGVLFRDEQGNEKRYKLKATFSAFTSYMKTLFPDVDWDENNLHIEMLIGEEIKE